MDTDPLKLRRLPPLDPPEELWPAVARQLDDRLKRRKPARWLPLGVAAGLALMTLGILQLTPPGEPAPMVPQTTAADPLLRLQRASAGLESQLDDYRDGVLSAPTADTIARMERELAWLDLQISEEPGDTALWAERVALLGSMLQRYLREDWRADAMLASY